MYRTSLVVQWIRILLPVQGTQVWSLVQEDFTCHGATKLMHHNWWRLLTLGPMSHSYGACMLQLQKPVHLEPVLCKREATATSSSCTEMKSNSHSPPQEKACLQQQRPAQPKTNHKQKFFKNKKEIKTYFKKGKHSNKCQNINIDKDLVIQSPGCEEGA